MFEIMALVVGLWPRLDLPPVEPAETAVPLSWIPVGPEGGSVLSVHTFGNGDSVLAVAWPNLWISTNQGATWSQVPYALFGTDDGTLTADRSLLMAKEGGLMLRSTDWGMSWDTVLSVSSIGYKILNQEKLNAVYTACQDTVLWEISFYRSTDNGENWSIAGSVRYEDELYVLAAAPTQSSLVFFACGDDDSTFIYRSTDGGTNWTRVLSRGTAYPDVRAIAVHPTNPMLVFAALSLDAFPPSGVLIVSTDMGNTWSTADSGKLYTHLNFYQDTLLLASSAIPEGIKRFKINPPQDTTWLYNQECVMWTDDAGGILWGATNGVGVIRSLTNGVSWEERNTNLYGVWAPTPHQITACGNTAYIIDYMSGRVYKSTNGGSTWARNQLNPVFDPSGGFMIGLSIHAATENLVYAGIASLGTFSSFYRTTDGGVSWIPVSILTAPLMFSLADRAQDTLYGLGFNLITTESGVFKSIDRGGSWNLVRPYPIILYGLYAFGDVKVSSWGHIFMTDTAGVSRSTNGGASWAQMSPNLQMAWWMDTTGNAVFFSSSDTNFQGVWSWNNSTWQWHFYGGDSYSPLFLLPDVAAEASYRLVTCWTIVGPMGTAAVVASDTFPYQTWGYDTLPGLLPSSVTLTSSSVILGTVGNGFYRADFQGMPINENLTGPGMMSAWVSGDKLFLNLPQATSVSIRIYDVSGRMREEMFNGGLPGGLNSLELPKSMPSGVYMVKVDAGDTRVLKWTRTGR